MAKTPVNGNGHHRPVMAYIALGMTVLINALTIGYTWGGVSTRLAQAETRVEKVESKVDAFATTAIDMAVVKNQLNSINDTLKRLEAQWGRGK